MTVENCVVYDSVVAVRAEDKIENLTIRRLGIGHGVQRPFQAAGGGPGAGYEEVERFTPPPFEKVMEEGRYELQE